MPSVCVHWAYQILSTSMKSHASKMHYLVHAKFLLLSPFYLLLSSSGREAQTRRASRNIPAGDDGRIGR